VARQLWLLCVFVAYVVLYLEIKSVSGFSNLIVNIRPYMCDLVMHFLHTNLRKIHFSKSVGIHNVSSAKTLEERIDRVPSLKY